MLMKVLRKGKVMEKLKITSAREVLLYQDSVDARASLVTCPDGGLQHKILLNTVATGQAGLESFQTPYYKMTSGKEM